MTENDPEWTYGPDLSKEYLGQWIEERPDVECDHAMEIKAMPALRPDGTGGTFVNVGICEHMTPEQIVVLVAMVSDALADVRRQALANIAGRN
jgi:hypothetical protein